MATTFTRVLGRSGIEVSALGLGCWAIGGPWTLNGSPAGWSTVDDAESLRALRTALDLGVTFFDTAANYGLKTLSMYPGCGEAPSAWR